MNHLNEITETVLAKAVKTLGRELTELETAIIVFSVSHTLTKQLEIERNENVAG